MQFNKDGTMFVTASKDNTAKLFDSESLMLLKTYKTERPVNSATISPIFDHVRIIVIFVMYLSKFVKHMFIGRSWRRSRCYGCHNNINSSRKIRFSIFPFSI